MKISINELKTNILKVLSKNMNEEDATVVADCLVWVEMCGIKTQGIIKMTGEEPLQCIIAKHPVKVERETAVSALLDGGGNLGMVVADRAVEIAAKKAKESGMAVVGSHNFFSSTGAQSYWVERLAKQDLIGIMVSRPPGSVAPFNSIDPLFGTNPIGFAFPTNDDPIIFDGATAAIAWYGLVEAKAHGEEIPEGVAIDGDGNFTIDPTVVMEGGAIVPFGNSYKAAGLGMLVELLAGPLSNGAFLDYKTFDKEWGATIIAIDPNILVDVEKFKADCSDFVSIVRNSRTKAGEPIRFPNDEAHKSYKSSASSGIVEVDDVIYRQVFGERKNEKI
jgi:LDH2 family malate/lactate/ureidoglycolate dehydrogenase